MEWLPEFTNYFLQDPSPMPILRSALPGVAQITLEAATRDGGWLTVIQCSEDEAFALQLVIQVVSLNRIYWREKLCNINEPTLRDAGVQRKYISTFHQFIHQQSLIYFIAFIAPRLGRTTKKCL